MKTLKIGTDTLVLIVIGSALINALALGLAGFWSESRGVAATAETLSAVCWVVLIAALVGLGWKLAAYFLENFKTGTQAESVKPEAPKVIKAKLDEIEIVVSELQAGRRAAADMLIQVDKTLDGMIKLARILNTQMLTILGQGQTLRQAMDAVRTALSGGDKYAAFEAIGAINDRHWASLARGQDFGNASFWDGFMQASYEHLGELQKEYHQYERLMAGTILEIGLTKSRIAETHRKYLGSRAAELVLQVESRVDRALGEVSLLQNPQHREVLVQLPIKHTYQIEA